MMTTAMNKELKSVLDGIPSGMCIYRVDQGRLYPLYHNPAFFKVLWTSSVSMRMTATRCRKIWQVCWEAEKRCGIPAGFFTTNWGNTGGFASKVPDGSTTMEVSFCMLSTAM